MKIFAVCSDTLSQSIGRGRISREGALDVRESRERRDKKMPKKETAEILDQKQRNLNFHWGISIFLAAAKTNSFWGGRWV